jgi:hypothetical protein
MATTTARDVVLHTPGLLENIILFQPVPDILTKVQKVSRSWKSVIVQSPTIQRKLWLKSGSRDAILPTSFLSVRDLPIYPISVVENPITRRLYSARHRRLGKELRRPHRVGCPGNDIVYILRLPQQMLAQVASGIRRSWLAMFITEPSITTALLTLELEMVDGGRDKEGNAHYKDYSEACLRDLGGLTFWSVLVAAEKIRQSAPADAKGRDNAQVGI